MLTYWPVLNIPYKDLLELGLEGLVIYQPISKRQSKIQIKYKGYINLEEKRIERFYKWKIKSLPADIDYFAIHGLSMS